MSRSYFLTYSLSEHTAAMVVQTINTKLTRLSCKNFLLWAKLWFVCLQFVRERRLNFTCNLRRCSAPQVKNERKLCCWKCSHHSLNQVYVLKRHLNLFIIKSVSWFNVFYSPTVTSPDVIWLSLEPHTFMYPDFVFHTYYVANHYFANF